MKEKISIHGNLLIMQFHVLDGGKQAIKVKS